MYACLKKYWKKSPDMVPRRAQKMKQPSFQIQKRASTSTFLVRSKHQIQGIATVLWLWSTVTPFTDLLFLINLTMSVIYTFNPFPFLVGSKVGDAFRTALTSNQLGWALVESSGDRCDFSRPARMLMRERERVRPKQPKPRKNYDVYNMMVLTTLHHFLFQCLSVALAKLRIWLNLARKKKQLWLVGHSAQMLSGRVKGDGKVAASNFKERWISKTQSNAWQFALTWLESRWCLSDVKKETYSELIPR